MIRLVLIIILITPAIALSASGIINQSHDFGNVGIDFTLKHYFKYVNVTDQPVRILKAIATCDCSSVISSDSLLQPGDTGIFTLTFSTRDYYGPTNKSIDITTDNPQQPEFKFFYMADVGQWFNGLKPDPISVFFLPGKKTQRLTIPNLSFDNIEITDYLIFDKIFELKLISKSATTGGQLELEITASENLSKGTHQSVITLTISTGNEDTAILTVPVKIVRY